jgi:hypothetical protein
VEEPGVHGSHAVFYDEDDDVFDQTSDEGGLIGHVVKLREHMHHSTLYGYQISEDISTC